MTQPQARPPRYEEALSQLWAGTLEELRVSLPLHRVVMTVRIDGDDDVPWQTSGEVTWYEVAFEGVTRFEFSDTGTTPWTVTELAEIAMRKLAEDKTEYVFELTVNPDALTIVCADAKVTLLQKEGGDGG